jgi:hypothetical protein
MLYDTTRCGMDLHSENVRSTVATENPPVISGLVGATGGYRAVVRKAL